MRKAREIMEEVKAAREARKEELEKCPLCNKEMNPMNVQQGGLHMGCYETKIPVLKVTLVGEKNGYFDKDVKNVTVMLEESDIDDGYTVRKVSMKAGLYFNLPEFEGF